VAPWSAQAASSGAHPAILAVALSAQEVEELPRHVRAPGAIVLCCPLSHLDRCDLRGPSAPALILSPLVARGFDCMDLLLALRDAGFAGRYLVLSSPLPHIPLIRNEIRAVAGTLDIDIIALGRGSVLHLA
jgi:hypothetical protein